LRNCADARGTTLYVTLEPCAREGRQPPCTAAIIAAGVRRVVVGALDPNPVTGGAGIAQLRAAGIDVEVRADAACERLIEDFTVWITSDRPYVGLKMASSLDGFVVPAPGETLRLTGDAWFDALQQVRFGYQAVMVGAGTVLIDDPVLTVRGGSRCVPFTRIIIAGRRPLLPTLRVFQEVPGYSRAIVVAADESMPWVTAIRKVADVVVSPGLSGHVDLRGALTILRRDHAIHSLLCEGGPLLASGLFEAKVIDRIYWVIAPRFLSSATSVPVLAKSPTIAGRVVFDRLEKIGEDVLLSGKMHTDV